MTTRFYIRSTEIACNNEHYRKQYEQHLCTVQKIVDTNKLLVSVDPSIPGYFYPTYYNNNVEDINLLVIAPRHQGFSLVPEISQWPCHVYMCIPKASGNWESGPYDILDWGVIEPINK